jgi:DNA-binding PadR family transcriptional regulator
MTATYAMGGPWLRFAGSCGPEAALGEWVAKMASQWTRQASRTQSWGGWGSWGGFDGSPPFGPPWARGGRGPKARRGDVRAAILGVLAEESRNGYQIIQEIAARSNGAWKPSPGSIYPTLQQLEDEGLVQAEASNGRRTFALTDQGRQYVADNAEEIAAPWKTFEEAEGEDEGTKPLIGQVAAAIWQIMAVGTPEQQAKGREAIVELRRKLYNILAEDDDESSQS